MPRKIGLKGRKIAGWTVIKESPIRVRKFIQWVCRCTKCKSEQLQRSDRLNNGTPTLCAFCKAHRVEYHQQFCRWTVINAEPIRKKKKLYYQCECVCGTVQDIVMGNLTKRLTSSCRKCQHIPTPKYVVKSYIDGSKRRYVCDNGLTYLTRTLAGEWNMTTERLKGRIRGRGVYYRFLWKEGKSGVPLGKKITAPKPIPKVEPRKRMPGRKDVLDLPSQSSWERKNMPCPAAAKGSWKEAEPEYTRITRTDSITTNQASVMLKEFNRKSPYLHIPPSFVHIPGIATVATLEGKDNAND